MDNFFANLPDNLKEEWITDLLKTHGVRIERIVSRGHTAPESGWYDQDENEWVLVLQGAAIIEFESGEPTRMGPGDYLNIPARCRHRVTWTDPEQLTLWLAVFYV